MFSRYKNMESNLNLLRLRRQKENQGFCSYSTDKDCTHQAIDSD